MTPSTQRSVARAREGAAHLTSAHEQLTNILGELDSELSSSIPHWQAGAVNAYAAAHDSWGAAATRQQEILKGMPGTTTDG